MAKLIYPDECYLLYKIFYEMQNELGTKFQEKHYVRAAESKFTENKIPYQKNVLIKVYYNRNLLGKFYVDFIVWNKIILEFKTSDFISQDHIKQLIRYLESTGLKLGLIINFRKRPIKPKRVINLKGKIY